MISHDLLISDRAFLYSKIMFVPVHDRTLLLSKEVHDVTLTFLPFSSGSRSSAR